MFNSDRLKQRIIEKYGTQKAFADALGVNKSTVNRYLSGREWRGTTMLKAARLLDIPAEEVDAYFFEQKVVKRQPTGAKV